MIDGSSGNISNKNHFIFKNLREITGSLLVYDIKLFSSLGQIFPNLRVIGGYNLIMDYALVVFENPTLTSLGLSKLRLIRNGGIAIIKNDNLCYAESINWGALLTEENKKHILVKNTKSLFGGKKCSEIPDCEIDKSHNSCEKYSVINGQNIYACWDKTTCQFRKYQA